MKSSYGGAFENALQQEVERVGRFVQAHVEELWMQLLSIAEDVHSAGSGELNGHACGLRSRCDEIGTSQALPAPLNGADIGCVEQGFFWESCRHFCVVF